MKFKRMLQLLINKSVHQDKLRNPCFAESPDTKLEMDFKKEGSSSIDNPKHLLKITMVDENKE